MEHTTTNTTTAAAMSRVEAFCRAALELSRVEALRPEALQSLREARMAFLGGIPSCPEMTLLDTYCAIDRLLDRGAKISSRDLETTLESLCKTRFGARPNAARIETLRVALLDAAGLADDGSFEEVALLIASPSEQTAGCLADALVCVVGLHETDDIRGVWAAFERLVGALLPDASF